MKEGDTVKLVVISIDQAKIGERRSSLKQAGPDPWASVNDRYGHRHDRVRQSHGYVADFGRVHRTRAGAGRSRPYQRTVEPTRSRDQRRCAGWPGCACLHPEIDQKARRISLSISAAAETAAPAAASTSASELQQHRLQSKKRPVLRGGLDF